MSLPQLFILAAVSMVGLAILRVARFRAGRSPLPEAKRLFLLLFVVVPPVLASAIMDRGAGAIGGVAAVPQYGLMLFGLAVAMGILSLVIPRLVPGGSRALVVLALTGSEGNPEDMPFDPPVTARLAESLALVDRANRAFPRGPEFPTAVERAGFRDAWDDLDTATQTLEGQIVEDHRLGAAVASSAQAVADDARARLDTLRRIAADAGQSWAVEAPIAAR